MSDKKETGASVEYRVFTSDELRNASTVGWEFVSAMTEEEIVWENNPRDRYITTDCKAAVVHRTVIRYLFCRSLNETVRTLQASVEIMKKDSQISLRRICELADETRRLEAALSDAKGDAERATVKAHSNHARNVELLEKTRRMEEDLGRLRERLGTERFNELVAAGDKEKC